MKIILFTTFSLLLTVIYMFIGEEVIKIVDRLGGYDKIKTNSTLLSWAEIFTMILWPLILIQIVIVGACSFIIYGIKFLRKLYKIKKRRQ